MTDEQRAEISKLRNKILRGEDYRRAVEADDVVALRHHTDALVKIYRRLHDQIRDYFDFFFADQAELARERFGTKQ